ncbi:hypothetical protein [Paraburkholderia largidicola]|uniref:Uncharacterized protein n=1 Tax=Paraburkholderia largidicola TaxID=3014751 RepID=A0A7I8C6G4_9BURK|nr:hypothetical protein [Paraburkholderia sp. PGU16]BCF95370.1 hypothetical protein PPGU16_84370 [Paraburkholderia sp. PGU16]
MTAEAHARKGMGWEAAFSILAFLLLAMNLLVRLLFGPVGWLAVSAGLFSMVSGTTSALISWLKGDGALGMVLPAVWVLWGSWTIFQ